MGVHRVHHNPPVRATYGSNRSHNARARSATASIVARMISAGLLLVRAPATRNDPSPVIQALLSHAPRTTDFSKHISHICAFNRHRHRRHGHTHHVRPYAPRYPGLRSPDANGSTTSPCAAGDMALTCERGHQCDATPVERCWMARAPQIPRSRHRTALVPFTRENGNKM